MVCEESYRVVSRVPLQQVRRVCGRAQAMEHSKSWLQNVLPASTDYVSVEDEAATPWEGRQGEADAATAFLCGGGEAAPPALCESTPVRGGALVVAVAAALTMTLTPIPTLTQTLTLTPFLTLTRCAAARATGSHTSCSASVPRWPVRPAAPTSRWRSSASTTRRADIFMYIA